MSGFERPRRFSRAYWARVLAMNVAASLVVTLVYSGVDWRTPPRQMLEAFGVAMLFSCIIGPMLGIVMPRVGHHVACRFAFPFDWVVLVATMIVIALAGSFTAILILAAIGYLHGAGIVATWMAGSLKASIVITLIFGIFVTVVESMRRRLEETTVALRTKERDEAEARRLAAEAQLASIESRVEPHFLFNTLNSIAALVHDDPAGAERMTGQLASLLRSALDSTATPIVPLDDELRVVRAYLDIERVRFGDRLRYTVDLVDGAGAMMVPRMALQTLVENSVKYAVSPRRGGASIHLHATPVDSRLRLIVEDDGPGFDPADRPPGHGLDLLERRLRLLFGNRASLTISSQPAVCRVMLDVPAQSTTPADATSEPRIRNPESRIPNPSADARIHPRR
jgi:two-component system sensor histidine kinase AlgZ